MNFITDSLEKTARDLDIKYNLPRKPNQQHLSSYHAFLTISSDVGRGFFSLVCSLVAAYAVVYALWTYYELKMPASHWSTNVVWWTGAALGFAALIGFILDVTNIKLGYRIEAQEETHGSSIWATAKYLLNKEPLILFEKGKIAAAHVAFALFGNKYVIAPHRDVFNESFLLVGPPGSGKTASILIPFIRNYLSVGCMMIFDPKGEIYQFTRHFAGEAPRLDFSEPIYTDFFDIFGSCRRNTGRAAKIAQAIISDPENPPREPFWENSAIEMLKLIILHLTESIKSPTARDIIVFLAENLEYERLLAPDGKEYPQLKIKRVLSESPNADVRASWKANFNTQPSKTFDSIKSTMTASLNIFNDPKVLPAFTEPTEDEIAVGRKIIDLSLLRKMNTNPRNGNPQGNVLYLVVPEGEARRLKKVVTACFQVIIDYLRESGDNPECPCFMMFEEAGNVPPPELPEIVNVGRGRGMPAGICLQNIGQLRCYGEGKDQAIMEGVATTVILPGVKGKNADYAVALAGRTTVLQKEVTDAVGNKYDSERSSQVGRNLIDADEVRRMPYFSQMLIFFRDFYPIKARFPANGKVTDPRKQHPVQKTQVNLTEIEEREELFYRFQRREIADLTAQGVPNRNGLFFDEPPAFIRDITTVSETPEATGDGYHFSAGEDSESPDEISGDGSNADASYVFVPPDFGDKPGDEDEPEETYTIDN